MREITLRVFSRMREIPSRVKEASDNGGSFPLDIMPDTSSYGPFSA